MTDELKKQVEALIFSCGRWISLEELSTLIGNVSKEVVIDILEQLQKEYNERDTPLMVAGEGDMWKLTIREAYIDVVRKINPNTELSKTIMETLAVVAWKQPILQSEVIHIRTNKAYDHISELEKLGFLIKERYGRTYMLKLTKKFLDYFDLKDQKAARELFSGFKDAEVTEEQKKVEEYEHEDKEKRVEEEAKGNEEETIYSETDRDQMVDNGEISPKEDAFMDGYEKADMAEETIKKEEEEKANEPEIDEGTEQSTEENTETEENTSEPEEESNKEETEPTQEQQTE